MQKVNFENKSCHYPGMQEGYNKYLTNFRSIICEVVAYGRLETKDNS